MNPKNRTESLHHLQIRDTGFNLKFEKRDFWEMAKKKNKEAKITFFLIIVEVNEVSHTAVADGNILLIRG